MSDVPPPLPKLGSLVQSARSQHLKQARVALLVIGILTILANLVMLATVPKQVEVLIAQQPELLGMKEAITRASYLYTGAFILLGIAFVILGLFVNKAPVPITVTGLVLFIGGAAVNALVDPSTLLSGLIVKIIIIVALVKAIQAAVAYEKERNASPPAEPIA